MPGGTRGALIDYTGAPRGKGMRLAARPAIERRLLAALEAEPPRIPVIVGGCGSGRTAMLRGLGERLGTGLIDLERIATTPERCLASVRGAVHGHRPAGGAATPELGSPQAAFDRLCRFFTHSRSPAGEPVTFLLDEMLEIRTFESFPGLRGALPTFRQSLCDTPNRFVLATRFATRTLRLFRDAPGQFEFVHLPPLTPAEVGAALAGLGLDTPEDRRRDTAGLVHALTDGRPRYVRLLGEGAAARGAGPVDALAAQLRPGAPLSAACRFSCELRLHHARGQGALKAILHVLAAEEPLTLTEIAQRLGRTPGATRDYLSWLEDVDLIVAQRKRYGFADPLLRLWVRLHGQAAPPNDDDLSRGVQEYVAGRTPAVAPDAPGE